MGADELKDVINDLLIPPGISGEDLVDFATFVESPEYLGLPGVYAWWLENLSGRLNADTSRLIFRGSTGAGKTTAMNLAALYKLYILFSSGPDVVQTLQLLPGTPIYFLYFSVSMAQAKKSGFGQLRNFIDGSRWFSTHYPRRKDIDSSIQFSNGFSIDYASTASHQIGLNVWGFILDEANFRKANGEGSREEFEEVITLANKLETRLAQRFLRQGHENFFAGYVSSASYETAFIQDKGEEYKDDPHAIVLDPVLYKVDPARYSVNRFEVFTGFGELGPTIVTDENHKLRLEEQLTHLGLLPDAQARLFEEVPLELKDRFKSNIYLALQDICGRPTALRGSFVTNYEIIREAYIQTPAASPLLQDEIIVSNKDNTAIESIVAPDAFEHPEYAHTLFLDLSTQGDYGSLSCVRYDGEFAGVKHHTHVFTLAIIPPAFPAATDITKIQNFIIFLAGIINIAAFGSDNYQSAQLRQNISKALDLPDIRTSLDSTDLPHLAWLSACASHRFHMRHYERLDREIREAVHNIKKRRVEKRKDSSDDQFQSCVGAFFLSDTVASTGVVFNGGRANIVGANAAGRLLAAAGYTPSFKRPTAETYRRKAVLEQRRQTKIATKLDDMLNIINK